MSAPPPSAPRCNLIICTIEILNKLAMLGDSIVKFETITDLLTDTIHIWGENPIFRQISNVWKPNSDFCERKIRFSIKIGLKNNFFDFFVIFLFLGKILGFLGKILGFLGDFFISEGRRERSQAGPKGQVAANKKSEGP